MTDTVIIEVDDQTFKTHSDVLNCSKFFYLYLKNEWKKGETIVIDRDAVLFRHILNFLRGCNYLLPKECVPELVHFGIEFSDDDIDHTVEELRAEINELKLMLKKKCEICDLIMKSSYSICPKHIIFPGWLVQYEVDIEGKGWIPSSDVKIGDMIALAEDPGYAKVTQIYKRKDDSVRYNNDLNFAISDGLLVAISNGFKKWGIKTSEENCFQSNVINFELDRVRIIPIRAPNNIMFIAKTF